MKKKLISGFLSFALIASSVLPAGAIVQPSVPTDGARVWADDVRVEANRDATVKVQFEVDSNSRYTKISGARASVSIPVDKTGISTATPLQITAGENVSTVRAAPSLGTTGSGKFNLVGSDNKKSLSVNMTVPTVKQTFPISVTPDYVSAKEPTGTDSVSLTGDKVNTAFGSVIVQYPVTVTIDGQKPAGASVSVKTTEYDTGKKTYAPGGTATELNTNDKFWVDSDTSNNEPVLEITPPEGYTAEVTVNDSTATKSSGNVSLGAVAKDTTVKVKFVQGQDTNVYVTYNANGGVGTDQRIKVEGVHQVKTNTFTRDNYVFSRWTDDEAGKDTIYKVGESKNIVASLTLYAQWFKQHTDGSIEVPGKDMGFGGDKDKDNVTVKPGADNKKPSVNGDGNVVVPSDSTGKVNVPDKTNPDKKTEVEVPGGTTVKPDGTITLPDGTELDPATPNVTNGYVVTYEANNGTESKRIVYVKTGEQHTVEANSFTYAGHVFSSWRDADTITGTDKFGTMVKVGDPLSAAKTLKALWFKQDKDGTITVPGVDGNLTKTEDNVSVKSNDSTKQPTINPDNGNAKVPTGTTGRIDRKDPANNDKTETIIVPEGTEVKPDGTIVFPGSKEVGPNEQITDDKLPAGWITVTYNSNNANSQTAKQVGASPVKAENNMFTPEQDKAFEGWYENKNFSSNKIAPGANVSDSKTLYARWKTAGTGDFKYSGKIEFHSNLDTDTTYEQIVSSADSASIAATLETPFSTEKPIGWELLGWSTEKNGAASGKWYAAGASVTVANTKTLVLYAIWHKTDNNNIVLPGVDGNTGTVDTTKKEDNVTVKKDNGTAPSPNKDKGYVEAATGNKINLPKADKANDVTVVTGPVNVYPDGTIDVPKGSKVTLPDGSTVDGPAKVNPDGTVTGGDKPYVKPDGTIVIPGPDKKLDTNDDVYVQPEGKKPTGTINPTTGEVTTNKDTTVKIPGKNPPEASKKTDVTVPNGTKISADGTITLPENAGGTLKRDSADLEVPAGSKIDAYGVVTFRYTVKAVLSKDNSEAEADRPVMVKEGVQHTITANAIEGKIIDGKASVAVNGGAKTNDPDAYVVTFKYKLVSDVAGNNKVVLTIKHMYRGYEMGAIKQQIVDKNQEFKAVPEKFSGYAVKTYTYNAAVDQTVTEAGVDITVAGESTITFVYDRTDNSAVVPVDKIIANGNDVVVKPTDSTGKPTENDDKSVTVPAGGAVVTTPDAAVKVPEGTKVKEDGTIILPDTNTPIDPAHPENVDPDKYCYVKYMPNGATGGSVVSEIFKKGETATILPNTFIRLNYQQNNWNTAENGLATPYKAGQTTDVSLILFAQWTEAAFNDTLKITLYRDGAKTESKEHTLGNYAGVVFAGNLPKNVFTVAGWTFAGWNTKADGTGDFYADGANITRNKADGELELYAQWYKKNQDGSITVPGADLVPETDKDATAKSDTDADLTRDGKTGVITIPGKGSVTTPTNEIVLPNGGKLHPNGTVEINKADGSTTTVKPDGTTDPANALTVTYKANGPADTKDVVVYVDNASSTVIANPFNYDGYVFSRWQVEGDTSREYVAGNTIDNITQNLALKAMWFKVGPNGEITVPGKDGELEPGEKEKDNVTVNPDPSNPDKKPAVDNATGNVKVPDGAQGEVVRPLPGTEDKTESIIVPGGTAVKPDGTIVLPDGKEIAPDGVIDENNPQGWIIVTYKSNNSKNEEKKQLAQTSATILNNVFEAEAGKAFDSWNEKANGTGAEVKNTVTESKTIYAIWKNEGSGNIKYRAVVTFHSNTDPEKTSDQVFTSADSKTITGTLNTNVFTAPAGWTLMGWSENQNGTKGSTWYGDGAEISLTNGSHKDLYAIWHQDNTTSGDGSVVLPGKDGKTDAPNITVKPGAAGNNPSVKADAGYVEAKDGNEIEQPNGKITVVTGPVNVYPDGTVEVPEGSKVTMPDGSEKDGPVVINPDGTIIKPDGTTIYPDGSNNGNNNNGGNSGNHGSSSGGSSTTTYTIKATAGNGGSISPKGNVSVVRSSDKLFNFTADAGYEVASVLVDGKDIGKVSSYNFTNVRAAHTIEVKFKKIGAVDPKPNTVADPKETGVANKLETDKHDAYMKGYANGTFGPNANMTRAEAAQMFYNLLLNKQPVADAGFTDVAADRWYADAVNTLAFMGIINGVGNNQFAPSRTISRAEFAAIATRFAKANSNGSLAFTDVKRSDWFYNSVLTAVNYGWIGGYSNGTFKPNNNITRAEVVSIVNKMLARSADKTFINSNASSIKSFTDVSKSFWGFYEVTEATNGHDHVKNDGVESWQ